MALERDPVAAGPRWPRGRPAGLRTKWGNRRAPCPIRRLTPLEELHFDEQDPYELLDFKRARSPGGGGPIVDD